MDDPGLVLYTALLDNSTCSLSCSPPPKEQTAAQPQALSRTDYINWHITKVNTDPGFQKIEFQDFDIVHSIKKALTGKGRLHFRSTGCGAQGSTIIFDPHGDLYTCWEMVGKTRYKVGSYKNKLTINEEALNLWYMRNISTVESCSKCKYALLCGGRCMAKPLVKGMGFKTSDCDSFPGVFRNLAACVYTRHFNKNSQTMDLTGVPVA